MLFLGFSAGLPFYLVFSTLSAWLRTRAHRTRHHRHAGVGRPHVLIQMDVGADRRSRRASGAGPVVRPAPLMDAHRADRRRLVSRERRAQQSRGEYRDIAMFALVRRVLRGDAGHRDRRLAHRVRDRRTSRARWPARTRSATGQALMTASAGALIIAADLGFAHELPHHGRADAHRYRHDPAGARATRLVAESAGAASNA